MKKARIHILVCATSAVVMCGLGISGAHAAEVAPGAPIKMILEGASDEGPAEVTAFFTCSQGLPGTVTLPNGTQRDVMVGAAHCLKGVEVDGYTVDYIYAPGVEGNELIAMPDRGQKTHKAYPEGFFDPDFYLWNPDWATAELNPEADMTRVSDSKDHFGHSHGDPVVLTGVRDYRDLGEYEVSFDNFGQPICKDGQTTGRSCGIQLMRTRNNIWSANLMLQGDSGGVNYDPNNGEALGASSKTLFGVFGATQPFDVALEEAYDIPDGQVNERFALPESTEEHDPMVPYDEYNQRALDWFEKEKPEEFTASKESVTVDQANLFATNNALYAGAELRSQVESATRTLMEDPTAVGTVVDSALQGAEALNDLAQQTVEAYDQAFANLEAGTVQE